MNYKEHTRLDLVAGGNVFKQGDHMTLGFTPRDYEGDVVDLTGKDIEGVIYSRRKGIMFTAPADYVTAEQKIEFTIDEVLDHGEFQIEFTVTDAADPEYRRKFPSAEQDGRLIIKPSADNMDVVGVQMTTVSQLKNELQGLQSDFESSIVPQVDELKQRVDDGVGAFTEDTEVLDARMGEPNLRAFNEKLSTQLAETAKEAELRIERERINNLIAVETSTDNAETADIRVGVDGVSYDSAGDAVRQQLQKRVGKTILSNKLNNPDFEAKTSWSDSNTTNLTVANNEITWTAAARFANVRQSVLNTVAKNKYYVAMLVKAESPDVYLDWYSSTYGASYATKYHSGGGTYELLSFVSEVQVSGTSQMRLLEGGTTFSPISMKKAVVVNLTEIFGAGKEPTHAEIEALIIQSTGGTHFFKTTQALNVVAGSVNRASIFGADKSKPLYIKLENQEINVVSKYSATKDMRYRLRKKGPNSLFDFNFFYQVDNTGMQTSDDLSTLAAWNTNSSDWFPPYRVAALNNIDGDNPNSEFFTGGNHGYENTGTVGGTNTATARNTDLRFFVDGREVSFFEGYANKLEIKWTNRVQAYNTTKADGTGREVLEEQYAMLFDGDKWSVRSTIEFLEPVNFKSYFGLQVQRNSWKLKLLYRSAANRKWNDGTVASNSIDTNCNIITMTNGTDYLDVAVDDRVGLGRKMLLNNRSYNAYASTSKSYFWLVDEDNLLEAGDTFTLEGYYRFYVK